MGPPSMLSLRWCGEVEDAAKTSGLVMSEGSFLLKEGEAVDVEVASSLIGPPRSSFCRAAWTSMRLPCIWSFGEAPRATGGLDEPAKALLRLLFEAKWRAKREGDAAGSRSSLHGPLEKLLVGLCLAELEGLLVSKALCSCEVIDGAGEEGPMV